VGRTVVSAFGGISRVASDIEDGAFDGYVCGAIGAGALRALDSLGYIELNTFPYHHIWPSLRY